MVHSITLLITETAPAPQPLHPSQPSMTHAAMPVLLGSRPPSSMALEDTPSTAPHADAPSVRDSDRIVMDPHALRSAGQSRGVARLAQDSGRPLLNSRPNSQDRWQKSIEQAAIPDCLKPDPQGMGLLNAPVLIFKAITDKCK